MPFLENLPLLAGFLIYERLLDKIPALGYPANNRKPYLYRINKKDETNYCNPNGPWLGMVRQRTK